MGQNHYYNELKELSCKRRAFAQRRLAQALDPDVQKGVCFGVTVAWLNEKINKPSKKYFEPLGRAPQQRLLETSAENAMKYAATIQRSHKAILDEVKDQDVALDRTLAAKHLQVQKRFAPEAAANNEIFKRHPEPDGTPVVDFGGAFKNAIRSEELTPGRGVLISFAVVMTARPATESQPPDAGHSVAFYKSRGGHLHFFDSNCGVYTIRPGKEEEFIDAWARVSAKRWSAKLTFAHHGRDGVVYTKSRQWWQPRNHSVAQKALDVGRAVLRRR